MSYSSVILADSPTGYWRLGESSGTAADNAEGTAARDGVYTGSPTLGASGIVGGGGDTAVTFPTNSYVQLTDEAAFEPGSAFTLELWVKRVGVADNTAFYSKATGGNFYGMADGTLRIGNDSGTVCTSTSTALVDYNWHHVVVTYAGTGAGNTLIYIDGTEGHTDGPQISVGLSANSTAPRIGEEAVGGNSCAATMDEVAVYQTVLNSTQVATHYAAGSGTLPSWTSPANSASMSTTPQLEFNSPHSEVAQHFYLQLDTAATFDSGSLRTYDSSADQTNWTYWDGDSWEALPAGGLSSTYAGNEIRYTVTSALSSATWYRRVRAGTLT